MSPLPTLSEEFSVELPDKQHSEAAFRVLFFVINAEFRVVSSPFEDGVNHQNALSQTDLYDPSTRKLHPRFHRVLRNLWDLAPHGGVPRIIVSPFYAMSLVPLDTIPDADLAVLTVEALRSHATLHLAASRFALTRRELQVLALVLDGSSGPQIAQLLNLAESTIQTYFKKLLEKTGSPNRYGMIAKILGWERPPTG